MFPTIRPVTKENMNYASVVAGGIAVFALGWWVAGAKNTYRGPRLNSDDGEESNEVHDERHRDIGEEREVDAEAGLRV